MEKKEKEKIERIYASGTETAPKKVNKQSSYQNIWKTVYKKMHLEDGAITSKWVILQAL